MEPDREKLVNARLNTRRDYLLIIHSTLMVITVFLKLFMLVVLCFYVAPAITKSADAERKNHEQLVESKAAMVGVGQMIERRAEKLDETYQVAKKIRDLLEVIDKRARDIEEKKKKNEKKKE